MDKVLLTVKEFAEDAGISMPKAYELTRKAGFPVVRLNQKSIRIPVDGYRAWANDPANWINGDWR